MYSSDRRPTWAAIFLFFSKNMLTFPHFVVEYTRICKDIAETRQTELFQRKGDSESPSKEKLVSHFLRCPG